MSNTMFYQCFGYIFAGVYKVIAAPATKNEPEASEVPHLQHGIIIMSQIKNDDCFTKRGFRPFQNVIQIHQILRLPRRRRPKPPLILTHACQCFSSAPRVLQLPQRWKSVRCPAPVTQNHVPDFKMSRKYHACKKNEHNPKNGHCVRVKLHLGNHGPHFNASLRSRNAHGHLTRELLRKNLQRKNRRPQSVP